VPDLGRIWSPAGRVARPGGTRDGVRGAVVANLMSAQPAGPAPRPPPPGTGGTRL